MTLPARPVSPLPFDPFLREVEGAERVTDLDGVRRAVSTLLGREVMVGTDGAELLIARCIEPLTLRMEQLADIRPGTTVAVSDHRGVQFVGFRAAVGSVVHEAGATLLRLFVPSEAYFYPGRRYVRIDGAMGADVVLEYDDQIMPARTMDVSMGGIGLRIPASDGFVIGQVFIVHLNFSDATLSLSARVRTAVVEGEEVRLGLEFAARSPMLEERIRSVLSRHTQNG